jgi:hypothetical protein
MATNGIAYYYVTGPVHCYARIPLICAGPSVGPKKLLNAGVPVFLGHNESSPKPEFTPKWKGAFSSLGGEAIPDDKVYLGQEVRIILELSRFNETLINYLMATPTLGRTGNPPGSESYLDIGSLLQRNGKSFELWLRNGFYGTRNSAAYPDMTIGKYFLCCNMAGITPANLTRDTSKVSLMIEANWVTDTANGFSRTCFTSDPAYFASLPAPN